MQEQQEQQEQQGKAGRQALTPSTQGNRLAEVGGGDVKIATSKAPLPLPLPLPRFGKPTGELTIELQSMVDEIALRRGATLMRRVSRQVRSLIGCRV